MATSILRSRWVLPINSPPIENGAVAISGDRITAVDRFDKLPVSSVDQVTDLEDSILLPGLINCHCHLDYTDMAGMIPPPKRFPDWIKSMIAIKASWSYTEFAKSWVAGARMLESTGTTSVVDIEAVPELLPEVWLDTPLRIWSCFELINIKSANAAHELVAQSLRRARQLETEHSNRCGISPHALYTTTQALRQSAAQHAHEEKRILTTHVAESKEEFAMYRTASGSLYDWLHSQNSEGPYGQGSPTAVLEKEGFLGPSLLAAHVNELASEDEFRLSRNRTSVVHCPRSHSYFGHTPFPWERLDRAGVNLTLGTDSLASVLTSKSDEIRLDMFSEMATLASQNNAPSPETILHWCTLNAAKAIDRENHLGQIAPGYLADLIAIPCQGPSTRPYEDVIQHQGNVTLSMIGGKRLDKQS